MGINDLWRSILTSVNLYVKEIFKTFVKMSETKCNILTHEVAGEGSWLHLSISCLRMLDGFQI